MKIRALFLSVFGFTVGFAFVTALMAAVPVISSISPKMVVALSY